MKPSNMAMLLQRILSELGLHSLYDSPRDTKILILQRFIRFFAFGGSTIVLALYLHAISISDTQIGLFMSLTLVGDLISFALTLLADGVGRKIVLGGGALLMMTSGVVFAVTGNFWCLLAASVFGVISPNGREIGPFSAIEESTLAHLIQPELRSDVFAWYVVLGSVGNAAGKLVTGFSVQALQARAGWSPVQSYRAVFFAYAVLGFVNFLLSWVLSTRVELWGHENRSAGVDSSSEEEPLLAHTDSGNETTSIATKEKKQRTFLPRINKESRTVLAKLCLLFSVDSLASGLVPASLVTYFFNQTFGLQPGDLGTLFFVAGILSSISSLVAASLARRIGLINTMVFTHLPSAIALSLIPVSPSLSGAIFFLLLRSSLASMDIAPKAAFLSVVVMPEERTAVMGFISVVRTFSQSCGPVITGVLAQSGKFWVTFVVAGSLKASYDLGLMTGFRGHKTEIDRARQVPIVGDEEDE